MRLLLLVLTGLVLGLGGSTVAQPVEPGARAPGPSGLLLPRFVSLAAERANLRTGPGERYPILWVYVRPGIPLQITAEYGHWRRVRDSEGAEGWMHSALLSGSRTATVTGGIRPLHDRPRPEARIALRAEPGVTGRIEECREGWCRMRLAGRSAWIRRAHIWGTFAGETVE